MEAETAGRGSAFALGASPRQAGPQGGNPDFQQEPTELTEGACFKPRMDAKGKRNRMAKWMCGFRPDSESGQIGEQGANRGRVLRREGLGAR